MTPRLPLRGPGENLRHYIRMLARIPVRRAGFDLIRVGDSKRRETLEQAISHLHVVGVRPASVLDVGVATGTPELYRIFPDARYLLVDPLEENEPHMKAILERLKGEYVVAAAAAKSGTMRMNVSADPRRLWGASLFATQHEQGAEMVERTVPTVRLDDVLAERKFEPPFLIKIDAEGAELEVLKGAEDALQRTLAVILEVALVRDSSRIGVPLLAEVVDFMAARGFEASDIVAGFTRAEDRALMMVDMVFLPSGR